MTVGGVEVKSQLEFDQLKKKMDEAKCNELENTARMLQEKIPKQCSGCGFSGANLRCSRCKNVAYCGRRCQKQHWQVCE